ncbi:MAG TPA: S8 family serine peptidase [Bacteroidia bacterium]
MESDIESKFKVEVTVLKMFVSRLSGELSRIYQFKLNSSKGSEAILRSLEKNEFLEYAEFAPVFHVNSVPNDLRNVQWSLRKISAIQAWNIRVGDPSILMAIVDDAVDINHEDLKPIIYTNTGEIPGNNNDDDNNGYIDDVHGWNATYRIPNPNPPFQNRRNYTHGTHCAGIAGAATNNALGIASIGSNISILPVSTSDSSSPGTIYNGYEGIVYAVDNGARVISLSWGSSYFSRIGKDVVADAVSAGAILVAAAGNSNTNLATYPASYAGVIAVGATDSFDRKAAFSNYGTWVDIFAPGVDIWSSLTGTNQKYGYMSGTSMSCPMVAGLCALILSQNDLLTAAQVEACLKSGADNINGLNPGYGGQLGAGRINAFKSLKCIKPLFANFKSDIKNICPGNSITFTNKSSQSATTYLWTIPGAVPSSSTLKNPTFTFPANGQYTVKLLVSDGTNKDSVTFTNYIQVVTPSAKMINATVKVKLDESAFLGVELIGTPPFKIKVSDGSNILDFYNIKMEKFYFDVAPSVNSKYYLLSMSDAMCSGPVSDTAYVVVDTTAKQSSGGTGNSCANFDLYTKTYDFGSKEQPYFIYTLRDGNIAIAGLSDKKLIGGDDIFLTKLRPDGAVIWTKYYGTTSNEIGYPINIFDDKEFNIYISGASLIHNPNTSYYFKLDSAGNSIGWTNKHNGNGVQDQIANGLEMSNGNIVYVGTSAITSDQAGSAFINTKSNTRLWGRSFDTPGQTEHNIMVKELYKKLYVLGRTSFGAGGYGSYLMKMDLSGNVIWQKYIDYPFYDAGIFETVTHQNSIMSVHWLSINGSSRFGSEDIGVFHCDTNGNKIWSKIIGTTAKDDAGGLVRLGNYYYISGITYAYDVGKPKVFLIKMDINANIIWTKVYGAAGERLIKTQHSNLMTVGSDGSLNILAQKMNTTDDVILFKIDECGNSSCPSVDVTFNISTDNTSFSNSNFKDLGLLSVNVAANSVRTSGNGSTISNYCPPVKNQAPCDVVPVIKYKMNCMSDSVKFTDSSYSPSNRKLKNYKWVFHDSSIIFGKNVAFRYHKAGSYAVKLVVFSDTPNACSETQSIVIDVQDKLKANISASTTSQCIGDSVDLSVTINCGLAPYTIHWLPSQYFKHSNATSTRVSVPSAMYIKCFVRDANGATTEDSVLITVNTGCCAYMPDFNPSAENICLGESINFTQNPSFNNSNSKYDVYLNGTYLETINQKDVNAYKPSKPGLYKIVLEVSGNCKKGTTEREFYVHSLPFADAGRDTILCETDTIALGLPALAQHIYEWTGGGSNISDSLISNPYFIVKDAARLNLKVTDRMTGCVAIDSIVVDFGNNQLELGNDTAICEGAWLDLVAGNLKFNTKYLWNNGSVNPKFKIIQPGTYYVSKTNQCGTTQDTIDVGFKLCFCELIMPNAFSPDANAINEYFPEHYLDTTIDILIYNRWGEKLYEAENTAIGWDGTYKGERVQQDVYLYIIRYRNCRGRYVYLKGTFTLLR